MAESPTLLLNPDYAELLRNHLDHSGVDRVDFLVLVHDDEQLIDRLLQAMGNYSVALIRIPQSTWEMDDESLDELFRFAVNELDVDRIVLVGHSLGGTPGEKVMVVPERRDGGSGQNASSPVKPTLEEYLAEFRTRMKACELHFQEQFERIRNHPRVADQTLAGELGLGGLFYRCDTDLFSVYHPGKREFQPLNR